MTGKPSSVTAPKLLDPVRGKTRLKHYSIRTEQSYADWIKRYLFLHGKHHPKDLGAQEIEGFLTHLAVGLFKKQITNRELIGSRPPVDFLRCATS